MSEYQAGIYYEGRDGKIHGPFELGQMLTLLGDGIIEEFTLVRDDRHEGQWVPAGESLALAKYFGDGGEATESSAAGGHPLLLSLAAFVGAFLFVFVSGKAGGDREGGSATGLSSPVSPDQIESAPERSGQTQGADGRPFDSDGLLKYLGGGLLARDEERKGTPTGTSARSNVQVLEIRHKLITDIFGDAMCSVAIVAKNGGDEEKVTLRAVPVSRSGHSVGPRRSFSRVIPSGERTTLTFTTPMDPADYKKLARWRLELVETSPWEQRLTVSDLRVDRQKRPVVGDIYPFVFTADVTNHTHREELPLVLCGYDQEGFLVYETGVHRCRLLAGSKGVFTARGIIDWPTFRSISRWKINELID